MRHLFALALGVSLLAGLPVARLGAQSDLDAFMAKVLAARDENWKKLQQYILDEEEKVEVRGPSRTPLWGERREYRWYIRDGFFVRSPIKANGVTVGEKDRLEYEERFLERAKDREKQNEKGFVIKKIAAAAGDAVEPARVPPPDSMPGDVGALLAQSRQPQFIDSAYFLKFKFEQGRYALVGREQLDGLDLLRIEYYPTKLFTHEQDQEKKRQDENKRNRGEDYEAQMEKMMNKVSLVTIWVEPKSHQIVKYTFDNVNLDFLPAAWLLRLTDLKATMTMSQPFPGVWLPRDVDFFFGAMLAIGTFDIRYHLDYRDYKQASTSGRIKKIGSRP